MVHRHERRFGLVKDTRSLSCAIFRCTKIENRKIKPYLDYDMEYRWCVVCAAQHWILGDRSEVLPPRRIGWTEKTGYE